MAIEITEKNLDALKPLYKRGVVRASARWCAPSVQRWTLGGAAATAA